MKVGKEENADFSTVSYKSYDDERKTPIKNFANILGIIFCFIGLFILITSAIVLFKSPTFLLQISEKIIFDSLPFISFNEKVIGIIPTSVLFLLLSLFMFIIKDEKHFSFIQYVIAIVSVVSFLFYMLSI